MLIGGNEVKQDDADAERLVARETRPQLVETGEQETGVVGLMKIDFVPEAAEITGP